MELDEVREICRKILGTVSRVVLGYESEIKLILVSLLSNGHVLLEGVPGVAKTTLVKSIAKTLGLTEKTIVIENIPYRGFSRIQFTPDLMPSDITGTLIYNPQTRNFEPRLGPIFSYIVLADEINRAVPRTQSALLQAMQEREVTIGSTTYPLEIREKGKFFFVLATQNPVEQEATYPLPEAQLDRFLMRIVVEYPQSLEVEKNIYRLHMNRIKEPYEEIEPVVDPKWIIEAQETVAKEVAVPDEVLEYVTRLIRSTRPQIFEPAGEYFELGASPRAGIFLIKAAKAHAALRGSSQVEVSDVDELLFPVLNHRLIPRFDKLVEVEVKGERHLARYRLIKEGLQQIRKAVA